MRDDFAPGPTAGSPRTDWPERGAGVAPTFGSRWLDALAFAAGRGLGVAEAFAGAPPVFFFPAPSDGSSVVARPCTARLMLATSRPSLASSSNERVSAILSSKSCPMNSATCSSSNRSGQAWAIARASSLPVAKRALRSFSRPLSTTSDSCCDTDGFTPTRGGAGPSTILSIIAASVGPTKRRSPASISCSMVAAAKRSVRPSSGSFFTCSGDMYPLVPLTMPDLGAVQPALRLGDAEVDHLHLAGVGDHDVLRADVAVDDGHLLPGRDR